MNLRTRFALVFAGLGAVVATVVGVLSYVSASDRLLAEVDRSLRTQTVALVADRDSTVALASAVARTPDLYPGPDLPGPGDEPELLMTMQSVSPGGRPAHLGGPSTALPVSAADRALARTGGRGDKATTEVAVNAKTYRVLTTALGEGDGAVQVAVPVDKTHAELDGMAMEITTQGLNVTLVAAALGFFLARGITARLSRLTRLTEEISVARHVSATKLIGGRDEVGRLSASFGRMLTRLADAREAQERLVQDAAHELRTIR
ncbi:HAMP domain-containing protein [Streptomyces humi]